MFVRRARFVPILLALLSTLVLSAGGARAAIVTMTYDGVISRGFGSSALFGRPAVDLAGFDYRAVYRFDTGVGRRAQTPTFESVTGGTQFDEPTPMLGASLTVNGVTIEFGGDRLGVASVVNAPTFSKVTSTAYDNPFPDAFAVRHELRHDITVIRPGSAITARFDQPFVYEVDPSDVISLTFYDGVLPLDAQTRCCATHLDFAPRRVTLALAVPEPATWAAMVTGFSLLGAALRRRARLGRNRDAVAA